MPVVRVVRDALLATAASASVYLVSGLKIYAGNTAEFRFPLSDLWSPVLAVTAGSFVAAMVLLFVSRLTPVYRHVAAVLFSLPIALWVQANLFVWAYGVLDGEAIPWDHFARESQIEVAFLAVLLGLALVFARRAYSILPYALVLLLVMQIGDAWAAARQNAGKAIDDVYVLDESTRFVFGEQQNVIVLVLDAYQGSVFADIIAGAPEYAEPLDGFTWFRNATASMRSTMVSVPHLLSGRPYDNTVPIRQYQRQTLLEQSLPTVLRDMGYRTEYYTAADLVLPIDPALWSNARRPRNRVERLDEYNALLQATDFRVVPQVVKQHLHESGKWTTVQFTRAVLGRLLGKKRANPSDALPAAPRERCCNGLDNDFHTDIAFTNAMLGRVRTGPEPRVFKLYHLRGMHPPWSIGDDLVLQARADGSPEGLARTGRASLKLLALFLEELKATGIYDRSVIFVVADHGSAGRVSPSASAPGARLDGLSPEAWDQIQGDAIPLVLVKPAGASGALKTLTSPVTLGDVPNTAMELLGGPQSFPGVSMFSVIDPARERFTWASVYTLLGVDYMGDLREFSIKGDVFDAGAWSLTGTMLKPAISDRK